MVNLCRSETPIRMDLLLEQCLHQASLAEALLGELEATAGDALARLSERVSAADVEGATEALHAYKGAAGIVGATKLSELCRDGEEAGRRGDIGRIRSLLASIRAETDACLSALPDLRRRLRSAST